MVPNRNSCIIVRIRKVVVDAGVNSGKKVMPLSVSLVMEVIEIVVHCERGSSLLVVVHTIEDLVSVYTKEIWERSPAHG